MSNEAVMNPTHLSYRKVNDSGPYRRMTPDATPKASKNVEKAEGKDSRQERIEWGLSDRTINFVQLLASSPQRGTRNPVARKNGPSYDAKRIPSEVHEGCLSIPE